MFMSAAEAAPQLNDLLRRAQAGEEVVLTTLDDEPPVRLVPMDWETIRERRRRVLEEFRGAWKDLPQFAGATSASLQDELYDEHGLPK